MIVVHCRVAACYTCYNSYARAEFLYGFQSCGFFVLRLEARFRCFEDSRAIDGGSVIEGAFCRCETGSWSGRFSNRGRPRVAVRPLDIFIKKNLSRCFRLRFKIRSIVWKSVFPSFSFFKSRPDLFSRMLPESKMRNDKRQDHRCIGRIVACSADRFQHTLTGRDMYCLKLPNAQLLELARYSRFTNGSRNRREE